MAAPYVDVSKSFVQYFNSDVKCPTFYRLSYESKWALLGRSLVLALQRRPYPCVLTTVLGTNNKRELGYVLNFTIPLANLILFCRLVIVRGGGDIGVGLLKLAGNGYFG